MKRVLSIAILVFSFTFARAESTAVNPVETNHDVELVRQYINSHGNQKFKLLYSATNAFGTFAWGIAATRSLFIQTRVLGFVLIGLGGWNLYDNYDLWRNNHHYFSFNTGNDMPALELPLPPGKKQMKHGNSFTPQEVETIKNYIDHHRLYFLRVFNIAVDTMPLFVTRSLLPWPIGQLSVLTGTAINLDSLLFWYTKGRISVLQPYIDRMLGYPQFVVEEYRQIGQTLRAVAELPRLEAQALALKNPRVRMLVHFAAQQIAPRQTKAAASVHAPNLL